MSETAYLPGSESPGGVNYGSFSFQVKRWILASLAEAVASALPAAAAVPALGCFRVRVGDASLELAATDMERTVLATTKSVISGSASDGALHEVFVPARRLLAILKEAPNVEVSVTVKKNQAQVTAGSGSWTLALPDSKDYPELVSPAKIDFLPYGRERLLASLRAVRHVVCKDAGRPPLTQVEVKDEPGGADHSVVTASDGLRVARARAVKYPLPATCIPSSALDDLVRMLAGAQADEIGVAETEEVLAFQAGPVTLAVARRSTPFPDVDKLLLQHARENEYVLKVDRDELAAAVRRVRINADGETSAIVLEVSGDAVTVVARDKASNSATEAVPATWTGAKDRVLCVNHGFLAEMLSAHPAKLCEFRLGKDRGMRRSMVLLEGEDVTQVIGQMPPSLVGY